MNNLFKLGLGFALTAILNTGNAFALTSNGNDGALVLSSALTLNASNNQVFNYTVVNLQAGSTLDFSGLNSGDSVFILSTGDLTINGTINLPSFTSFTFETSGNILFGGSVLTSNSNVSFISNAFQSSSNSLISDTGGNIAITAGTNVVINGKFDVSKPPSQSVGNGGSIDLNNPSPITLAPVPEPSSYVLLALGSLVMTYRLKRFNS